jgi:hypothetical protein
MHGIRRVAILQGEYGDGERFVPGTAAQFIQCRRRDAVDVILDRIDFGNRRKAGEWMSRTVGNDGGRSESMIEQALVRPSGFDAPLAGDVEVAEARIIAVDMRERLEELCAQIGRRDIEFTARHIEHHRSPAERRQPVARRGDAVDERLIVGRTGKSPAATGDRRPGRNRCAHQEDSACRHWIRAPSKATSPGKAGVMRGAGPWSIVSAQIPAINCIIKYYQLQHAAGNPPQRDLRPKDQAFF